MTFLGLCNLAENEGIEIDYFPMNDITAVSFPQGWIVINKNKNITFSEEKVCLAHELGHCMTGSFYNINSRLDMKAKYEYKANKWAIKTLIPENELKAAIKKGYKETWELAEYFNVPEPFVVKAMSFYKDCLGVEIV